MQVLSSFGMVLLLCLVVNPVDSLAPHGNGQGKQVKRRMFLDFVGMIGSASVGFVAAPVLANDQFQGTAFASKSNVLTSRPLEALRIAQQEEVDNIKYGGELAMNGPPNVQLLVPIAKIELALRKATTSIEDPANWDSLKSTLTKAPFSKKEFKQTFNAFADNIYYSPESDRANAYLGGGATPSTQQTTQYMLRNEILGNCEIAGQELDYLIGLRDKGATSREALVGEELDDLRGFLNKALKAMDQYLSIPPPGDVAEARRAAMS